MVTDYLVPFRALATPLDEDSFDEGLNAQHREGMSEALPLAMTFSLADGKRSGCQNLKLDDHGIELCLRRGSHLPLPFNHSKTLSIRVIRAATAASIDTPPENQNTNKENSTGNNHSLLNTSNLSGSSSNSRTTSRTVNKKQNKTALACLVGRPAAIRPDGTEEPITDRNFTYILRLNY